MKFILGKKLEMAQIWREKKVIPVTLIEAGPCWVTQLKTRDRDGYGAIQIGFIPKKKRVKKTEKGKEFRHTRERRIINNEQELKVGHKIDVSVFQEGESVKISGISKGKGFQGVVKKWGFHGRNATHGVKHEQRAPGSVGSTFPQKVVKGRKMAGRMGNVQVTVKNLKIVKIDTENNLLAVKGAVPGRKGTLLEIRSIE